MKKLPKIFIIILNWKRADLTLECISSISSLVVKNFLLSVLVIDNNSKDNSFKKLKNCKIPNGKYFFISNKRNLGYAGGMNVGFNFAFDKKADFVVALNNDVRLDANLLLNFLKTFQKQKGAGVLSPKIYFEKGYEYKRGYKKNEIGKVIWSAGGSLDWNNVYGSNRGVDEVDCGQYNKVEETDFATGNCMFINVKALKKVGLFDERYFMYLEDLELSIRMKNAGYKVLYSPNAFMWHKVAQSSGIGSELNDYFITRNRMLFGLKYASFRTKLALVRESFRLLRNGRKWQKIGIRDFYLRKFGKGSWK